MDREYVTSSNLRSVGYDKGSETMEVEFNDGSVYQYYNVPESIFEALMLAPSKGEFLHDQVKGRFAYGRVG